MEEAKYCGFMIRQRVDERAPTFFVFAANPSDIIKWSVVERVEDKKGGIQRRLSEAHVRALKKFFEQNSQNTIPNSIVLAFPPGAATFEKTPVSTEFSDCSNLMSPVLDWGTLTVKYALDQPAALIVDGQHRLFSMAQVKEPPDNRELPVLVSALIDVDSNEMAFQFIVINNKVTKVPPDLVRSIIVDFSEDELQLRLESARISLQPLAILVAVVDDDADSPFFQMVQWERRRGEGRPTIRPVAIEDSVKSIRRTLPKLDEDEDALIEFFFAMWNGVKASYPELWKATVNNLLTNAGVKALSEYLSTQIGVLAGLSYVNLQKPDSVRDAAKTITSQVPVEFWQANWRYKSLDTSAGRQLIKEDLATIRANVGDGEPWQDNVALVRPSEESFDEEIES